ncbi:MAG TPA: MFS transporter [Gaiellaceae bacterium]
MRAFVRECIPSLPRVVWFIQLGNVVNFFGFGLVLPFELIYLHDHRGFSLPTSGLIVSTIMTVNVLCTGPAGSLVDRVGGKTLLFVGSTLQGIGYGSLAFVTAPWHGFVASAVTGLGAGMTGPAAGALVTALTTREERIAAFTVARVSINFGIGLGSVVAGAIVASGTLRSFQTLYLLNAATFFGYLCFVAFVPNARGAAHAADDAPRGYRFVLRHRLFLAVVAANFVFVVVGYTLFGYAMPIFARHDAGVSTKAIGAVFGINTIFIIVVQLPLVRILRGVRRRAVLALMCAAWGVGCLVTLAAAHVGSTAAAVAVLGVGGIAFGIGECLHAIGVQPFVADLAPPHLMGRYMALFGISFSLGLAGGPAASGGALALSPSLPWLGGAVAILAFIPLLFAAPAGAGVRAAPSASSSAG